MKAPAATPGKLPIGQMLGGMDAMHEAKGFSNDEIAQGHKKLGFTNAIGKFQPVKRKPVL